MANVAERETDAHKLGIMFLHREDVPAQFFDEFTALAAEDGIDLELKSYPQTPFAGLEQYLPTVVVLYLTKAYFDGFLNEMGREHYQALKAALKGLRSRLDLVKVTVFATAGKVTADETYSRAYSMVIPAGDGHSLKFLLRNGLSDGEQEQELDIITDFVERYRTETLDEHTLAKFSNVRVIGRTILLACDLVTNEIVPVDVMPHDPGE